MNAKTSVGQLILRSLSSREQTEDVSVLVALAVQVTHNRISC